MQHITLCLGCYCMTKTIRKSRAKHICGHCGYNKIISEIYLEKKLQGK